MIKVRVWQPARVNSYLSLELFGRPDGDVLPVRDLVLELPVHEVAKLLDLAAVRRNDPDVSGQDLLKNAGL